LIRSRRRKGEVKRSVIRHVIARGLILVIVAVVTIGIMIAALELADRLGWIAHPRVATAWMPPDWPKRTPVLCHLAGDLQTPLLECVNGTERRRIHVEFRGSLHATEWRCTQSGESLICTTR
jgi:hypothetical protein